MFAAFKLFIVVAATAIVAVPAFSASASPQAKPVLKACYEDWGPYVVPARQPLAAPPAAWVAEGATGVVPMLIRVAAGRIGMDVTFQERSLPACFKGVARGDYDLLLIDKDENEVGLRIPVPVAYWTLSALVPKDSALKRFTGIENFAGLRLLRAAGYTYSDAIEDYDGWTTLDPRSPDFGPRMVAGGRADVYIDDLPWLRGVIEKERLEDQVRVLQPPIAVEPQYVIVTRKRPEIAAALTETLTIMSEGGEIDRAYEVALNWTFDDVVPKTLQPSQAQIEEPATRSE